MRVKYDDLKAVEIMQYEIKSGASVYESYVCVSRILQIPIHFCCTRCYTHWRKALNEETQQILFERKSEKQKRKYIINNPDIGVVYVPIETKSIEGTKEVFKTEQGYFHEITNEGWYLADGERNYSFTDDVFEAYGFEQSKLSPNEDIPKYIGVTHDEEIENRFQMCEVLKGKFVKVKIKTVTTTEWEEME